MDVETKRRVEQLSAEGWSQRAIAEAVGVSRGAVWRALQSREHVAEPEPDDDEYTGGIGLVGALCCGRGGPRLRVAQHTGGGSTPTDAETGDDRSA